MLPSELLKSTLWWSGLPWLSSPPAIWPRSPDIDPYIQLPDIRPAVLIAAPLPDEFGVRFSSYTKLCRITARILRFYRRVKTKKKQNFPECLTSQELTAAERVLLKASHKHAYMSEISVLQKHNHLPSKRQYANLSLLLDGHGLLRVRGRLQKADLPEVTREPILLSTCSHIVKLLVQYNHVLALHTGTATVMARLALRFFIPRLKPLLKGLSRRCITSQRIYARTSQQKMGELPAPRVTPARPFTTTGVDFAGPVTYKGQPAKAYYKEGLHLCIRLLFS